MFNAIQEGFKAGIEKFKARSEEDRGDLVQTVIIVAGFAVAAIVIIGALSSVIINKGEAAAECISGGTSFTSGTAAKDNCETADTAAKSKSDSAIAGNFG